MVVKERGYLVGTGYDGIESPAVNKALGRLRQVLQRFTNSSAQETALGFKEIDEGKYCTLDELKEEAGL